MVARKVISALLVGAMIAAYVIQWRSIRRVQLRARDVLFSSTSEEMAQLVLELRRYGDQQSEHLANLLEERLKLQEGRDWKGAARRSN